MTTAPKTCFVVMPISDVPPYETGHFQRVFENLIAPACKTAGFEATRADQVRKSDYIIIDVLKKLLESDLVLCDLSARNPNVMYELGIAHAFNRRVVLIKDEITDRAFDISGLRQVDYNHTLRVDHVETARKAVAEAITGTHGMKPGEVNSVLQLLAMKPASMGSSEHVSEETKLILAAIESVSRRVSEVEQQLPTVSGSTGTIYNPLFVPGGSNVAFVPTNSTFVLPHDVAAQGLARGLYATSSSALPTDVTPGHVVSGDRKPPKK